MLEVGVAANEVLLCSALEPGRDLELATVLCD